MKDQTQAVVAPNREKAVTLRSLLQSPAYAERFKAVLGERGPQFVASLIQVGNSMPDVEPSSIIAAGMTAASLDLPVDKNLGFSWVVPYFDRKKGIKVAQFQIGWRGFVQLALRSSQYSRMNAAAVNAEAYGGRDEVGEPIIHWEKIDETKPAIGYAFAFRMVNGFTKVCYWPLAKVKAHAERFSEAYRKGWDGPWKEFFDRMAIKTVVRNELHNWGIMSIQIQRALEFDQAAQVEVGAEVAYLDNPPLLPSGAPEFDNSNPDLAAEVQSNASPTGAGQTPQQEKSPDQPPGATPSNNVYERMEMELFTSGITFTQLMKWAEKSGLVKAKGCAKLSDVPVALVRDWENHWEIIKKEIA